MKHSLHNHKFKSEKLIICINVPLYSIIFLKMVQLHMLNDYVQISPPPQGRLSSMRSGHTRQQYCPHTIQRSPVEKMSWRMWKCTADVLKLKVPKQ